MQTFREDRTIRIVTALILFLMSVPTLAQTPPWEQDFDSVDQAAVSALDWISSRSSEYELPDREVGGWISRNGSTYRPAEPRSGDRGGRNVDIGEKPENGVAWYHTHTFNNSVDFSGRSTETSVADHNFSKRHGADAYVRNPRRETYRYSESNGERRIEPEHSLGWTDPENRTDEERYNAAASFDPMMNEHSTGWAGFPAFLWERIASWWHSLWETPSQPGDYNVPRQTIRFAGVVGGDPHIRTFDGLTYSFQATGEYLAASSSHGGLEIQIRLEPWNSSKFVSVVTAAALNIEGTHVSIIADGTAFRTFIADRPTNEDETVLHTGGRVVVESRRVQANWPTGDQVSVRNFGGFLTVEIELVGEHQGNVSGLFGVPDDNYSNDLTTRAGEKLGPTFGLPLSLDDHNALYNVFGQSWRIDEADSLFFYDRGTNSATFYDRDFPDRAAGQVALRSETFRDARQLCENAGIQDEVVRDNCSFDFAISGNSDFITAAESIDQFIRVERKPDNKPALGEFALRSDNQRSTLRFWANAGEPFHFQTVSVGGSLDLSNLLIRDTSGKVVKQTCIRCNQIGTFIANRTGYHTLAFEVREGERGEFEVLGNRIPAPENLSLVNVGDSKFSGNRRIEIPGAVHSYLASLVQTKRYRLVVSEKEDSLYFGKWWVTDEGGNEVVRRTLLPSVGGRSDPFQVSLSGNYFIHVDGGDSWPAGDPYGTGDYSIVIEQLSEQ